MGYPPSHWNKINIHCGGMHGDKARSLARFAAALDRLSPAARARLTGAAAVGAGRWVGGGAKRRRAPDSACT